MNFHFFKARQLLALCLLLFQMIVPANASACTQGITDQFVSKEQLITLTKSIVIATPKSFKISSKFKGKYDYTMSVLSVLKGDKNLKEILSLGYDDPSSANEFEGSGADCAMSGGFVSGKKYLVFVNSHNEKGVTELKDDNDTWLLHVKKTIETQKAK